MKALRARVAAAVASPATARRWGLPPGFGAREWWRLLGENDFRVDPAYWPKAALAGGVCLSTSLLGLREQKRYGRAIADTTVKPPLFILGHWRTGTSHLHRLLAMDDQFAFPNFCQTWYPHTFLTAEERRGKIIARFLPSSRPMDNVALGVDTPEEDEFAMAFLTGLSPMVGWMFPRRWEQYQPYLTFGRASPEERARWKAALTWFMKKLTLKYGRPLLLKSPSHTARIPLLLELFPDARFVHIYREPYTVFQSTCHLIAQLVPILEFQRHNPRCNADKIIRQYRAMFDAFSEDRALIPAGRLHEVRFEALERDPLGQLGELYAALGLAGFARAEPKLRGYLDSLGDYRKNTYEALDPGLRGRIASEWRRSFDEWSYPT